MIYFTTPHYLINSGAERTLAENTKAPPLPQKNVKYIKAFLCYFGMISCLTDRKQYSGWPI
jgi:hypothetical protein